MWVSSLRLFKFIPEIIFNYRTNLGQLINQNFVTSTLLCLTQLCFIVSFEYDFVVALFSFCNDRSWFQNCGTKYKTALKSITDNACDANKSFFVPHKNIMH